MTVQRRAGAPRLIDWTGERCVPWTQNVQVVYEHYHRYLWAASICRGRRVLDVGSGEGFGSAIIAAEAQAVQGVDIDERTVAHSQLNYIAPNLDFRVASALDLGEFADGAFDVVVAFEVLEHLVEQARMLDEIDRVLAPDGLLIISTPDRYMYTESTGQHNPYHAHELSEPEFRALLGRRFAEVALWGQRTVCGSRIAALDGTGGERPLTVFLERTGDEWRGAGQPAPMYLVAVAARVAFEKPAAESTLVDHGIHLARQYEASFERQERQTEAVRDERDAARAALADEAEHIRSLKGSLHSLGQRHRAELNVLGSQLASANRDVALREADVAQMRAQLARVEGSVGWSAFQFVRWRVYRVIGEHSLAGRSLQALLQAVGRQRSKRRAAESVAQAASTIIRLPIFAAPVVSIVIPVHARADLTEACLTAIAANTDEPPYEVIVVDDAADADNGRLWQRVEGARVLVNDHNRGYLRSVNRGASEARGKYVVPLNNDTIVQPGWLSALVERAESSERIGVVAPKLLFPDGRLQEAGAIIFQDGTGWNYGRGCDPDAPDFNFVRDVDYGSGACLLVRAELWRELDGYDELFLPMYYEDTDLCFAARASGYRVVYEPAARVVHVEGGTAGTDESAGAKRYQELNRPKFVKKWRTQLESEQQPAEPENVRRASARDRGREVLVVDHRIPSPDRDSGSLRMFQMLSALVEIGCRVTFLPDNRARWEPYTGRVQGLGVRVLDGPVDVPAAIAESAGELALVIVSRPSIAARYFEVVREWAPEATIAYDTVDLHYLREETRAALGEGDARKAATLREIELGLVRASDITIVVTPEESAQIESDVPGARVVIIPNANDIVADMPAPGDRSGVLFVGGFEHTPNVDAAIFLVESVMPLVWKQLGPVRVTIAGPNAPAAVIALAGPDVDVPGWVPDLEPLLQGVRAMVAPLRYGAGMKGKVTQSLAAGLPVVTTTIGAQGLGAQDGREMLIADDAGAIADRIVRIHRDDELWLALSRAGRDVAERECSPALMRDRLEQLLEFKAVASM